MQSAATSGPLRVLAVSNLRLVPPALVSSSAVQLQVSPQQDRTNRTDGVSRSGNGGKLFCLGMHRRWFIFLYGIDIDVVGWWAG